MGMVGEGLRYRADIPRMYSGAMPDPEPNASSNDSYAYFRWERTPSAPIVFRKSTDKPAAGEALWGGLWLTLVSGRMVRAMESEGITGWATYPVQLLLKGGQPDPGKWFGLAVTGRCGELDWSSARFEERQVVAGGPEVRIRRGPRVPEGSWDGSDLVLPGETTHVLCTERFRSAMKRHDIRRLGFEMLDDMWDPSLGMEG